MEPINEGGECMGDLCFRGQTCAEGRCEGGIGIACSDDGNPCTAEVCTAGFGCHPPIPEGVECEDDNDCTTLSMCNGRGDCVDASPTERTCDPSVNPCLPNVCRIEIGMCMPEPQTGTLCPNGMCTAGVCACNHGWEDCDGDGNCECERGGNYCELGMCKAYTPCREECAEEETCCRCDGMCHRADCLSCCMFCPAPIPPVTTTD
jgi:hypothetical protein